jgi:hypothetical protein
VQASTLVTGPLLVKNVPYDAVKDFTAISEIGSVPLIMTVHPSVRCSSRWCRRWCIAPYDTVFIYSIRGPIAICST